MAFREVSVVQVKEALRRWLKGEGERPVAQGAHTCFKESQLFRHVVDCSVGLVLATPRNDVHIDAGWRRQDGNFPDYGSPAFQLLPAASCTRADDDLGDLMGASELIEGLCGIFGLDLVPAGTNVGCQLP